jgi:hypothetical protein
MTPMDDVNKPRMMKENIAEPILMRVLVFVSESIRSAGPNWLSGRPLWNANAEGARRGALSGIGDSMVERGRFQRASDYTEATV